MPLHSPLQCPLESEVVGHPVRVIGNRTGARDRRSPGEPPRLRAGGEALAADHDPVGRDGLIGSREHANAELGWPVGVPGDHSRRKVA